MIVAALVVVTILLAVAVVLLIRAIPDKVEAAVGRFSTEDTIAELRAAVKDLTQAAATARRSADRVDRATKEDE